MNVMPQIPQKCYQKVTRKSVPEGLFEKVASRNQNRMILLSDKSLAWSFQVGPTEYRSRVLAHALIIVSEVACIRIPHV